MKRAAGAVWHIPSPSRLFARVLVIVGLIEGAVMLLLPRLVAENDHVAAPIIDSVLLTLLSAPVLWYFVVRPLRGTALQEHARAAAVVANARDGIITINEQGSVESLNPAAEQIFGRVAAEVLGRPVAVLMPAR